MSVPVSQPLLFHTNHWLKRGLLFCHLRPLLTALAGQCEPRPFIYWDNHRCRHVLLLLLDLSTVWVCTIVYDIVFLYSQFLTPFVLSSMYNWTQMTSGRQAHWRRAAKQRSTGDFASFLSRQAAPCIGISLSSDFYSFDLHCQNISLSKHLFIRESSWRPQNISLQSF